MPLKNKYLKYTPEISLEIFKEIWTKLINSGWKATCDFVPISDRFHEFKNGEMLYNDVEDKKNFYINYKSIQNHIKDSGRILSETTVQEILGYDPFVKEENEVTKEKVIEKVIPEYVECINSAGTVTLKVGMIYRVLSKGVCSCGTSWYLLKDVNLEKRCACGNSAPSNAYNLNRFKPSTKEAFDAQNKPKHPLKQTVHCKTQEEWDFVSEKINYKFTTNFKLGYNDTININSNTCECKRFYNNLNYAILSFQEWCDLNGYKMEKEVEFKVGDWIVIITDGNTISKKGSITVITYNDGKKIMTPELDKAYPTRSGWIMERSIRHAAPEEINNHLISIGQIPAGESLNNGIEPNKDGIYQIDKKHQEDLIRQGIKIHEEFFNPTVESERNYGYTVNPKYKKEFNIINKTKTIKF